MIANRSGAGIPRSPDDNVAMAKEEIRRAARRARDAIHPVAARDAAERAAAHLLGVPELSSARRVAVFAAVGSELDAGPAARGLRARGVELAYPRVLTSSGRIEFRLVADDGELTPGTFGIPEPRVDAPIAPVQTIDVFVLPGLAFDVSGGRIGWGRGYYDRSLAAAPDRLRIGYCFDCQLVEVVPREPRDLPVHIIVTESGARRAR